jgi:uncharacterized protein YgiM (DUF1202 family)
MRLSSILWMVVTPMLATVGAVIVLTPSDILRQPVIDVETAAARAPLSIQSPVKTLAVADVLVSEIQPATLTVVSSPGTLFQQQVDVTTPARPAADRRWITARSLNMRTAPGKNNELVASLPFGTEVFVLETSGTWAHVEAGDVSGWLSSNFLTTENPAQD